MNKAMAMAFNDDLDVHIDTVKLTFSLQKMGYIWCLGSFKDGGPFDFLVRTRWQMSKYSRPHWMYLKHFQHACSIRQKRSKKNSAVR